MKAPFHPLVAQWFAERFGDPTPVQEKCWPAISSGGNVLATAPTGSGKTLAAFLWFIDGFISGRLPREGLSLLYVSPLKALNTDVRENLLAPLAELKELFLSRGTPFPEIRVMVRSGDSTPAERRLMLKRPPSILITTPESLAILVNSRSGEKMLSGVKALILDEIHAVAGTKRGAFLMCAVERLVDSAGEFQRIALSATVRPLSLAAEFAGGFRLVGEAGPESRFEPRPVSVIDAGGKRSISLRVESPGRASPLAGGSDQGRDATHWDDIASRLASVISSNRSTIVFTNSRRVAEQCCFLVNRAAGQELAYVHHGSLSKELRKAVETRMKAGALKGIVATSSLELGIDIGEVDEVVLLGAPAQTAQALQRIGRSGHGPGRTVRGRLIPLHDMDLLRSAILAEAILEGDIDPLSIPENPLDVLAQVLLGLCSKAPRGADELYALVRRAYNFRGLPRLLFDHVIEALEGMRGEYRVRGIKRRLFRTTEGELTSAPGAAAILAVSGGTIPDRGYYGMKLAAGGPPIGQLDEEFVWERRVGEGFSLGNQRWRIVSIGDKDITVVPWKGDVNMLPFWKAERQWRSPLLSARALAFLDEASGMETAELEARISARFPIEPDAAARLASFIASQSRSTGLPGSSRVPVERFIDPSKPSSGIEIVLHTLRGNGVNYPLMLILKEAFKAVMGFEPDAFADNDSVVLSLPPDADSNDASLLRAVSAIGDSGSLMDRLRPGLQSSGVFGAAFRENAIRALMVARSTFDKRVPLWLMRARAKALLEEVSRLSDFPIVTETWRECLSDVFDLDGLRSLLDGLSDGEISATVRDTRVPSPFSRGILWQETNDVLYRGDGAAKRLGSSLSEEAVKAAVAEAERDGSGPSIGSDAIAALERRLRRLEPGWAPRTLVETESHLRDRVTVERSELVGLFGEAARETETGYEVSFPEEGSLGLARVGDGAEGAGSFALPARADELASDSAIPRLLAEWSRFSGPFQPDRAAAALGAAPGAVASAIETLRESGLITRAPDSSGGVRYCDAQNLEGLYRLQRRMRKPEIEARPADDLALFLASASGIERPASGADGLRAAIDSLMAWPARPEDWEGFLLPSRVRDYSSALLDGAIQSTDFFLYGIPRAERPEETDEERAFQAARGKVAFAFPWEYGLVNGTTEGGPPATAVPASDNAAAAEGIGAESTLGTRLALSARARRFWDLKDESGLGIDETEAALWNAFFEGRAATNSFQALRAGIRGDFGRGERPREQTRARESVRGSRVGADRWKTGAPVPGEWFDPRALALDEFRESGDAIDEAESMRERVRILLRRHGVLFRALLERECPSLRFGAVFPALRRMELSGELVSGLFFHGIQGPQFMGVEGFRLYKSLFRDAEADRGGDSPRGPDATNSRPYALSAADPASLAGLGIEGLSAELPPRSPQNALVYVSGKLALTARKNCAEIELAAGADAEAAFKALASWLDAKARSSGLSRAAVLSIDGKPALSHERLGAAKAAGFSAGYRGLEYYPRA